MSARLTIMAGLVTATAYSAGASAVAATSEPPPAADSSAPRVTGDVLFEESFDDDSNGWGIIDHPDYGSTGYEDGDYVWDFTGSIAHLLPEVLGVQYDKGELQMLDVVIQAEATIVSGDGVIGVFCRENPDDDADFQWYEFVARDGYSAIRLADAEGNLEVLAESDEVDLPMGEPISFEASCVNDDAGDAQLSMSLNGDPVLTAVDDDPLENGAPGIGAWTFPLHEPMQVRWHEFTVTAPEG